jgi:threonylcarbamoyladenosine tRNA methylthiotransferase MtaB
MSGTEIVTLGCRLNAYESEVMRRHSAQAGLSDAVIVNTCAVTAEAVRQAGQTIRRIRRERPNARIIVTGCAAQIEPERFAEMSEVDHVIGNAEKLRAETFLALSVATSERVQVNDIMSVRETASHMVEAFGSRTRAYVQVQNGCDHRCTFCIIPFGRGPSRSVPAGEVVAQVRALVDKGYKEIVLTGVDITSYGAGLPGEMTLGKLVRSILKHVPDLQRLRLSSIDSIEADTQLLDAIANEHRLMPHLHLSLQTGDDLILKRMKRRHLRAQSIEFCALARRLRPDIVFGADIIAGFPTETEEMFQNSPRKGTPAARMPQVAKRDIKERARRLRAKGEIALNTFLEGQRGKLADVLIEEAGIGRTPHFAEIQISGEQVAGQMVRARVSGRVGHRLTGEVVA